MGGEIVSILHKRGGREGMKGGWYMKIRSQVAAAEGFLDFLPVVDGDVGDEEEDEEEGEEL